MKVCLLYMPRVEPREKCRPVELISLNFFFTIPNGSCRDTVDDYQGYSLSPFFTLCCVYRNVLGLCQWLFFFFLGGGHCSVTDWETLGEYGQVLLVLSTP